MTSVRVPVRHTDLRASDQVMRSAERPSQRRGEHNRGAGRCGCNVSRVWLWRLSFRCCRVLCLFRAIASHAAADTARLEVLVCRLCKSWRRSISRPQHCKGLTRSISCSQVPKAVLVAMSHSVAPSLVIRRVVARRCVAAHDETLIQIPPSACLRILWH
eukprot:2723503-Prymnesium_polylepis.1